MGPGVEGLGFEVLESLGFRAWGLGFRLGVRASGSFLPPIMRIKGNQMEKNTKNTRNYHVPHGGLVRLRASFRCG